MTGLRLDVFSDPLLALQGASGLPYDQVGRLVEYDEEILKPALLLGDRVNLRTWRRDLIRAENIAGARMRLAIPMQATIRAVVFGEHQGVRDRLGIDDKLVRDLRFAYEHYSAGDGVAPAKFFETEAVGRFVELWHSFHYGQWMAMQSPLMKKLAEEDVLREEPWDDSDYNAMSWPAAAWHQEHAAFDVGLRRLVSDVGMNPAPVLMDRALGDNFKGAVPTHDTSSTATLANAAELMRLIDGLAHADLAEVIDIRRELSEYLVPFRAFILNHARDIAVDEDAPMVERQRQAQIKWSSDVAPAIDELKFNVEQSSFLNQLIVTAGQGPESAIGVGVGLVSIVSAGVVGVTALAGLAVGALPLVIKAAGQVP